MKSNEVSRRQFSDNGQSWFIRRWGLACCANNHRGWQKMKKKNKRMFKKKFRRETEKEIQNELENLN